MKSQLLNQFIALSCILTAKKDLPSDLAEQYLNRLLLQLPSDTQALLAEFGRIPENQSSFLEFEVKRRLADNDKFAPVVQQILRLWYTGQFLVTDDKTDIRTREQYNSGLIWEIALVHAPGADLKQPYGYWEKHP